jgi:hypothetical protein
LAYTAAAWRDFAVTIGGLAGALTGLLFVAVSLHSAVLAQSRPLASRAAQTLVLFLTPAMSAVVLAAPMPGTALGALLLAVAVVSAVALIVLDRRAGHDLATQGRAFRYLDRGSPNSVIPVLFAVAGLTLLLKAGGGLYWMIPGVLASLVAGVVNAWLFLIKIPG